LNEVGSVPPTQLDPTGRALPVADRSTRRQSILLDGTRRCAHGRVQSRGGGRGHPDAAV